MSNQPRAHAVCGCEGPSSGLFSAYVQARWKNEALPPRARDDGSAALNLNTPRFASAALVSAEASRQRRDASAEATKLARRCILRARDEIRASASASSSGEFLASFSPSPFAAGGSAAASASRAAARMRAAPSAMARSNLCAASSRRPWCEYIRPRRFRISPGSESTRANDARSSSGSSAASSLPAARAAGGTAAAAAAASSAACSSASACVRPFTRRRE